MHSARREQPERNRGNLAWPFSRSYLLQDRVTGSHPGPRGKGRHIQNGVTRWKESGPLLTPQSWAAVLVQTFIGEKKNFGASYAIMTGICYEEPNLHLSVSNNLSSPTRFSSVHLWRCMCVCSNLVLWCILNIHKNTQAHPTNLLCPLHSPNNS